MKNQAVILIGMPGAGKSTLGVMLAKSLALPFVDTDLLIQQKVGTSLQDYLNMHGYMALREVEESVLLKGDFSGHVVATGGSVVYSPAGMAALKQYGNCFYLKISLETLLKRVDNKGERGLACAPGTSLEMLYHERSPLYENFADKTVEIDDLSASDSLRLLHSLAFEDVV